MAILQEKLDWLSPEIIIIKIITTMMVMIIKLTISFVDNFISG
jgi:hypothetical protein